MKGLSSFTKKVVLLFTVFCLCLPVISSAEQYVPDPTFINAKFYILSSTTNAPTRLTPTSSDSGYIAPGDLCTVIDDTHSTYWLVEYPVSSGTKRAYVDKAYILDSPNYHKLIDIPYNKTVYTREDMSTTFGSVWTTDTIYQLSPIVNGKAQIIYNVSGGYKIGWIYLEDTTTYPKSITLPFNKKVYADSSMWDDGKTAYGWAYTTDDVKQLTDIVDGKAQIEYNVTGGYKKGWIYLSDNEGLTKTLTGTLYGDNTLATKLTCDFDGYNTIDGHHEGIDFAMYQGKYIYSLIEGELLYVKEGSTDVMSKIAIYDPVENKTVIYLHLNPSDSLQPRLDVNGNQIRSVGQTITVGQFLGTEDTRGNGGTHTHVEVRNGETTSAAYSVNHFTLDNPNPYPYWNKKGYKVE